MDPDTGKASDEPVAAPEWCYLCSGPMVLVRGVVYCPRCDSDYVPVRRFWVYDSDRDRP